MKYVFGFLGLWLVLLALCLVWVGRGKGESTTFHTIYVRNAPTSGVQDSEVRDDVTAIQQAVSLDFAPAWGLDARLAFSNTPPANAEVITVSATAPKHCGCYGYHGVTRKGIPYGRAFMDEILDNYGVLSWTLTHELFEMLADPHINSAIRTNAGWYLNEVADPVEDDAYGYKRKTSSGRTILISDFILPSWYTGANRHLDFTNHVSRRRQVLHSGYVIKWVNGAWKAVGLPFIKGAR